MMNVTEKVEVAKKVIVGRKIEDQDLQQELYLKAIETPLRGETKEEQEEELRDVLYSIIEVSGMNEEELILYGIHNVDLIRILHHLL